MCEDKDKPVTYKISTKDKKKQRPVKNGKKHHMEKQLTAWPKIPESLQDSINKTIAKKKSLKNTPTS